MKISIDGLYLLINNTSHKPYPKLFISLAEATDYCESIGNHTIHPNMFINNQ